MVALDAFLPLLRGRLPGCPEMILVDAVRSACIEFCQRTRLFTESATFDTVPGQAVYALLLTGGMAWEVREVRVNGGVLTPVSVVGALAAGDADLPGTPRRYYLDGGGSLVLAPIPDAVLAVTVRVTVRPEDESTEVEDALYQDYREAIAAGARAWVRRHLGEWPNEPAEMADRGLFELAMARAIWRQARGGTTATLRVRSHAF